MTKKLYVRNVLGYAAVSTLVWVGPSGIALAQDATQSARASRGELASFDQFLDSHKEIAEQLRRDPKLIQDRKFVEQHPALQTYLQQNPEVREQLSRNPNAFIGQERGFDAREDAARDRDRDADRDQNQNRTDADRRPDSDRRDQDADRRDADARRASNSGEVTQAQNRDYDNRQQQDDRRYDERRGVDEPNRGVLANFDRFLDSHPEVDEQLRKDPSLARNQDYLREHPALQTYLQGHPEVQAQIDQHPNNFMRREERYDMREDARNDARSRNFDSSRRDDDRDRQARNDNDRDRDARYDNDRRDNDRRDYDDRGVYNRNGRDRDTTRGELASFDHFLDSHRETAEQLHRDPSLVKNQQFVQNHPDLQAYLQQHQGVREELYENPNSFMRQENRYDRQEDSMRGGQASFREFLVGHSSISQDLNKDPNKARDQKYVQKHPEFQTYLKQHPDVQTALNQDPHAFMKSTTQQPATAPTTGTGTTPKTTTTNPETKPPKQ